MSRKKTKAEPVIKGAGGFTLRDAQSMLAIARSATMPNMDEAEARSQLFQRYSIFIADVLMPKPASTAPAPESAKPKK